MTNSTDNNFKQVNSKSKENSPIGLGDEDTSNNEVKHSTPLSQLVQQLKSGETLKAAPKIVCKACHYTITSPLFLIPIKQSSHHVLTNPSGMSFDVQTFEIASGCIVSGTFTNQYSWFPGYVWQYAYCEGCGEHLGWHYKSESGDDIGTADMRFFGLITDHLTVTD